ncbi:MAG: squalene-associated FAD-dependent desaturase [Planctomycetota bacterium]|nr:squalene-associated FAD-dependent desaturase [Planctomycetota bacterium]
MTDAQAVSTTLRKPRPPRVVIVGGGLSGLAAAAALAGRGLEITLLESRPRLGGRAGSFTDPATGELVDNCQHVSMACCTNLADFCDRVGTRDLFRRVPGVVFLSPEGRSSTLKAGPWPAPFHLAGSFLRANYLTIGEKLRVAYGLMRLRFDREGRDREPFADWLLRHGQTPRTVDRYWGTVLISALNERLEQMDLGHARKVFLDGFLRNREGFVMEVPLVPLGELYGTRLESWLKDQGVAVRLTTGVRSIEADDEGAVSAVTLRNGEQIHADFVVLAAPFDRARSFFSERLLTQLPSLEPIDEMQASPITGVHFWFDREVCPLEHAVTVGRTVQWVFNHTKIQGREAPEGGGQYLQLVISAAYDLVSKTKEEIRDLAMADLSDLWPSAREATLLRWWVVTEHGATFAVRPGVDAIRPRQRTPIDGLFLSGDWTATGWPATMEGAVRAGYLAAEGVLEDLGRPEALLKPDLPDGLVARFLLGPPSPHRPVPFIPKRVTAVPR